MKAKFFITLLSILSFSNFASGQQDFFKVGNIKGGNEFSFPVFFAQAIDSLAAIIINQHLQLSELEMLKKPSLDNIFEKVAEDNGTIYGGKVSISYDVFENTQNILSLKFTEASCGATCNYWSQFYTFNSGNGDAIELKDIFSSQGFKVFRTYANAKCSNYLRKEFINKDSIGLEDTASVLECYQSSELDNYFIKGSSIFIDGEHCLMKYQRFLGLNMTTEFKFYEFKDYLNDYGRAIFAPLHNAIAQYRSTSLPQLFEGSIGESNSIIFIMRHGFDDRMEGLYAYLKYGTGIYLEGKLNGQSLNLTEKDKNFNDNAYIDATFDGERIIGTWKNKDKSKTMRFFAKRR
jgi:hypothetical protein